MKKIILLLLLALNQVLYSTQTKPNVVIFFVDDLGWTDIGYNTDYFPQGSLYYETPHLDSLASQSVVFHQAYAQPVCSSSRATLISGQYSSRFHLNGAITGAAVANPQYRQQTTSPLLIGNGDRNVMPLHLTTLAERLRDQHGYATWHVGKWHIGGVLASSDGSPAKRGFQRQFFTLGAGMGQGYFGPIKGPQSVVYPNGGSAVEDKYTHAHEILDRICRELIEGHAVNTPDTPFFLNFWTPVVHSPYEAHIDNLEYFESKLPSADTRHSNPVYASMIKRWDDSLGNLIQVLKDAGEYEDTLFIFWSDNGGSDFLQVSKMHDPNSSNAVDITPTPLPQYTEITSNLPLRDGKSDSYEGGVRVPALIHYPQGNFDIGRLVQTPVHLIDFFPTILDFAGEGGGVSDIQDRNNNVQPLDGVSIRSLLENTGSIERDLFHYRNIGAGTRAFIRRGNWKLFRWFTRGHDGFGRIELFNLDKDIGETTNLADTHIDIAAQMLESLDAWVESSVQLPPILNPNYDGIALDDPEHDYLGWILERHPEVTATEIGLNVDIDGDKLSNFHEYILDSNPIQFNASSFGEILRVDSSEHDVYFRVPVNILDTAYSVEYSDALDSFHPISEMPEEIGAGPFGRAVFGNSLVYRASIPAGTTVNRFYRVVGEFNASIRQSGTKASFFKYSHNAGGNEPRIVNASSVNGALPSGSVLEVPIGDKVVTTDLASELLGETYTISMDFSWWDLGGTNTNESVYYHFGTETIGPKNSNVPLGWGIALSGTGASTTGTFYIGYGDGNNWTDIYTEPLGAVGDDAGQFYSFSIRIDDVTDTIEEVMFNGAAITDELTSTSIPALGSNRMLTLSVSGSGIRSLTDNLTISLNDGETIIADDFNVAATSNLNAGLQREPVLDYKRLLFKDTFNIEDNNNINAGLGLRQFGPFAPAAYGINSNRTDLVIRGDLLDLPLTSTLSTPNFGQGADAVIGKQYRFEWNISWDDLNGDDGSERIWWTLAGDTGFKDNDASVQVGLDIDNAEFFVGLGSGSNFVKVGAVPLPGVVQGSPSPDNYKIRVIVDEAGPQSTLSVEFEGVAVSLSGNAIQWQSGNNRTFHMSASGSGIHAFIDDLQLNEL